MELLNESYDTIICKCSGTTAGQVYDLWKKHPEASKEEIFKKLKVGTSCRGCLDMNKTHKFEMYYSKVPLLRNLK